MITIGVLALQGAFTKHIEMLKSIGVRAVEVKKPDELEKCDGLIIPGGESTTIYRQINFIHLENAIKKFAETKPIFGTCAGLILISQEIISSEMKPFCLLDIKVERNGFGSQKDSFTTDVEVQLNPKKQPQLIPAVFIRAPRIKEVTAVVDVLAKFGNEPIFVRQGNHLGSTFHPELTNETVIHQYFLKMVKEAKEGTKFVP